MGYFDTIPVRSNGDITPVTASWWNIIRTQLVAFEALFGGGATAEAQFTVANNQSSAADVTDMVLDKTTYAGGLIWYSVAVRDDTEGRRETGFIHITYEAETDAWDVSQETKVSIGTISGVVFTITSAGQVQYTSANLTGGGYTGKMRWKFLDTFAIET